MTNSDRNSNGEYPIVERLLKAGLKYDNAKHVWFISDAERSISIPFMLVERGKTHWSIYQDVIARLHVYFGHRID